MGSEPGARRVDPTRLDPRRRHQAGVIARSVRIGDSNGIAGFGAGPQRKLSGLLDHLLAAIRAEEAGLAWDVFTELAGEIRALDLPAVQREAAGKAPLRARLPLVGRYVSALGRLRSGRQAAWERLADTARRMELQLGTLMAGADGLDRLLHASEDTLRDLEAWVAGGEQALAGLGSAVAAFEARLDGMLGAVNAGLACIAQVREAQRVGRAEGRAMLENVLSELPGLRSALLDAQEVERLGRLGERLLAELDAAFARDRGRRAEREAAVRCLGEVRLRLMQGLHAPADDAARQPQGTPFR